MGDKNENLKLGFMVDGKFKEIATPQLEVTTLFDEQDITEDLITMQEQSELTLSAYFENNNKGLHFLRILGIEPARKNIMQYRHIFHDISPNNWLKRHGLPMRRRKHKCNRYWLQS